MKTFPSPTFRLFGICFLLSIIACSRNKPGLPSATPNKQRNGLQISQPTGEAAALATISAKSYEVKIYGAFAFDPGDNDRDLIAAEKNHQFVVLDMSVENKSSRAIDIGQILLSARVMDEKGNVYPQNTLAVKAFEMEYPEPNHNEQYRAMKGKIGPGRYYRTTAYGFEAPIQVKNFIFALDEESNIFNVSRIQQAAFALE